MSLVCKCKLIFGGVLPSSEHACWMWKLWKCGSYIIKKSHKKIKSVHNLLHIACTVNKQSNSNIRQNSNPRKTEFNIRFVILQKGKHYTYSIFKNSLLVGFFIFVNEPIPSGQAIQSSPTCTVIKAFSDLEIFLVIACKSSKNN